MSLQNTINEKWKEAFKSRDIARRAAYELVKQRIVIAEKSGQVELPLSDEYITNLIIKEVKEREDVLTFYYPADPEYINSKLIIEELSQYLPKQMSEEEVIEIIKRIKATEPNLGKVIGLTVKEVGNRYDKSLIAALVKRV